MPNGKAAGFSYWIVLMALVLVSLGALKIEESWYRQGLREKEESLLFAGEQYRQAIASYYQSTPGPTKTWPRSLEALLKDDRFPEPRRHLRQLYGDPVAGNKPFLLIKGPAEEIVGVRSSSTAAPLKRAGFLARQVNFEKAGHYSDWAFVFVPPGRSVP